jgi:hypothetical protein
MLRKLLIAFEEAQKAEAKSFSLRVVGRTELEEMKSAADIKNWYYKKFKQI